jgi:hypothetical protein
MKNSIVPTTITITFDADTQFVNDNFRAALKLNRLKARKDSAINFLNKRNREILEG